MTPAELVTAIRNRDWSDIPWEEAMPLLQYPKSEELPPLVDRSDRELLMNLVRWPEGPPEASYIAIRLLRDTEGDSELRRFFQRQWQEEEAGSKMRIWYLSWALLDFDELETEWHEVIWREIDANYEFFLEGYVFFIGGNRSDAHHAVRTRLHDQRYPPSKRWIYLAATLAHPNRNATEALLNEDREPPDDQFTAQIRDELLHRVRIGQR